MTWLISAALGLGFVAAVFVAAWVFAPKGWRTAVFNAISGSGAVIVPVTEHLANAPWESVTDGKTAFFVVQGMATANVIWRTKTTTPLGKAE